MASDETRSESSAQLAGAAAGALAEASAHQAFKLFQNKEYRRSARFDALDQVEQDRIFNELVVAHLVLIMLILEAPDLRVPSEFRDQLTTLKRLIPKAYVDNLGTLGVEDEHLRVWEQLISLRYEEYAKNRLGVRTAAMDLAAQEKPLELDDLSRIQLLLPVQAVAIGCHHHVCRDKTDGRDELFKLTLKALARFYTDVRIHFEGGQITFGMKARRLLRRVIPAGKKRKH